MNIPSRTPEGDPLKCPLCGKEFKLDVSQPARDATCPHCGQLLWASESYSPRILVLDLSNAEEWDSDACNEIQESTAVVVDLTGISVLTSRHIGRLVMLNKKCQTNNVMVGMVAPRNSPVREVLRITKLHKVFQLFDSRHEALSKLREP